ncbi:MAG: hypothetical protein KDN22_14805 [Verrucomicrobiae bacterium]|nr:hypothetical protein [Verrucomicrobiae bacterium]
MGLTVAGCIGGFALAKSGSMRISTDERLPSEQIMASRVSPSDLEAGVADDFSKIAQLVDGDSLREQWESFGDDARGFIGRQRVLARWAAIDPEGGYEYFMEDWNTWISFLGEWALIDPQAATKRLISEKRAGTIASIAQAIVLRSPERCLELVAIWESTGQTYNWANGIVTIAFANWFADDREKALKMATVLSPEAKVEAMAGIAVAMARTNGASAIEWATALANPKQRDAAIAAVAVEIGRLNPDAAIPLLLEMDDPSHSEKSAALILEQMTKTDPSAAIDWAVRHFNEEVQVTGWSRDFLQKSFLNAGEAETIHAIASTSNEIVQANLISALSEPTLPYQIGEILKSVDSLSSLTIKTQMRLALLGRRTGVELDSAVAYIESLPEGEAIQEMWEAVFEARAKYGFESHSDLFWKTIDRAPIESQGQHIAKRLSDMVHSGSPETLGKLDSYREHPGYQAMASSVATAIADIDLNGAKDFIESLTDKNVRGQAASLVASKVPTESAAETFEWLQSIDLTEAAMKQATAWMLPTWARDNGIAASALVLELEPGPVRQEAITALISGSLMQDPIAALEWVEEIDDVERREKWRLRVESARAATERIGDQ